MGISMATDDHIVSQFHTINDSLMSINEAVRDCSKTIGRVEGVQSSQWGAIKRVEKGVVDVQSEVALLKTGKGQKQKKWVEAFTADNVKIALLIVVSVLAVVAGISVPL